MNYFTKAKKAAKKAIADVSAARNWEHELCEEHGNSLPNAILIASAPELLSALAGCADALREAGKDFARANPHAVRPNLYELHEKAARAAIAKATEGGVL